MADTNPYASSFNSNRALEGSTGGAVAKVRYVGLSYCLTAYGLALAAVVWHWSTKGFILYSGSAVEIVPFVIAPFTLPSLVLCAFGNWLSGYFPTDQFAALIGAILIPWVSLYWLFLLLSHVRRPRRHSRRAKSPSA